MKRADLAPSRSHREPAATLHERSIRRRAYALATAPRCDKCGGRLVCSGFRFLRCRTCSTDLRLGVGVESRIAMERAVLAEHIATGIRRRGRWAGRSTVLVNFDLGDP